MKFSSLLYFIFLLLAFSSAEIHYSHRGYFNLGTIHRLSDGSIIKIPYRMATYESALEYGKLKLNSSAAFEFRLNDINDILGSDLSLDLRELYLEWMTPVGDFSIGKQLIIWGSTSANSPTDNICPFNYYYLFSLGKERKEGILSFNSNIYWGNLKFNTIIIPEHNTNILPINDPEFAISSPLVPKDEQIIDLKNPYEYGLSVNIPFNSIDITTSYFSGYDRIVSFFGANVWSNQEFLYPIIPDTVLSYRKTDVYGLGFSALLGDFTIRADGGYFDTYDNIKDTLDIIRDYESGRQIIMDECEEINDNIEVDDPFGPKDCKKEPEMKETLKLDNIAKYYQYTLECEFSPNSEFRIIGQLSKHKALKYGRADSLTLSDPILLYPDSLFIPGMGAPNTFISNNILSISIQKLFPDIGLELQYISLLDLNKKGYLHEIVTEYELYKNMKLLIAANKIIADNNIQRNPFVEMENYSHIRFELKYFY